MKNIIREYYKPESYCDNHIFDFITLNEAKIVIINVKRKIRSIYLIAVHIGHALGNEGW